MFDDEATAQSLAELVDSIEESPFVSSGPPRLVVSVWPRPYREVEGLLPVVYPLMNHQYSHPGDTICLLADYQLLLSRRENINHTDLIFDTAAALLALGADPRNMSICRESDIGCLTEIYWLLSCILRLPPPGDAASPASRRSDGSGDERLLFLAAAAIGLGATDLVLDSMQPQALSLAALLREIERRLGAESSAIRVSSPPATQEEPDLNLNPDPGSIDERYRVLRHDLAFLRDMLNEGAMVASRIVSPAITCLRERLHLNDGSEGRL